MGTWSLRASSPGADMAEDSRLPPLAVIQAPMQPTKIHSRIVPYRSLLFKGEDRQLRVSVFQGCGLSRELCKQSMHT